MQAESCFLIQKHDKVLFVGDSITNAFRKPEEVIDAYQLGSGYALMVAAQLLRSRPGDGLQFFNRGVSGDTINHLRARWPQDVLSLKPTVISVLIGVNDVSQEIGGNAACSPVQFERDYRGVLHESRTALPGVRFVLCEPFTLRCGRVDERWPGPLAHRQRIVASLSREFDATFVPLQREFDSLAQDTSASYWIYDGIHPTAAGHGVIAQAWLNLNREPTGADHKPRIRVLSH